MPLPRQQSRQGIAAGLKLAAVTDWLADAGLRSLSLDDIVDGFARRLNEVGVPVARIFAGMNTLHPMVRARSLIWDRATGPATRFEFRHVDIDAPILRESPFAPMLRHGIAERRYDLTSPKPEHEVPLFEELRAAGMTDWLGRVFPFGELAPQIGGPADAERVGELWLVCSLTTDRPGGFADSSCRGAARAVAGVRAGGQGHDHARPRSRGASGRLPRPGSGGAHPGGHGAARRGPERGGRAVLHRPARLHRPCRHAAGPRSDRAPGRLFRLHGAAGHRARRRGPEIPGRRAARDLPDRGQAARRDLRGGARSGQGGAGADGGPGRDAPRPVAADARSRHRAACRRRATTATSAPTRGSTSR